MARNSRTVRQIFLSLIALLDRVSWPCPAIAFSRYPLRPKRKKVIIVAGRPDCNQLAPAIQIGFPKKVLKTLLDASVRRAQLPKGEIGIMNRPARSKSPSALLQDARKSRKTQC